MTSKLTLALPAVTLAAMLLAGCATDAPSAAYVQDPQDFSDDQLRSYAAASIEVDGLQEKWSSRLAEARNASEQAEVREEAAAEISEAVRDQGLSVEEYNQIRRAAQADPETARTVHAYRSELQ